MANLNNKIGFDKLANIATNNTLLQSSYEMKVGKEVVYIPINDVKLQYFCKDKETGIDLMQVHFETIDRVIGVIDELSYLIFLKHMQGLQKKDNASIKDRHLKSGYDETISEYAKGFEVTAATANISECKVMKRPLKLVDIPMNGDNVIHLVYSSGVSSYHNILDYLADGNLGCFKLVNASKNRVEKLYEQMLFSYGKAVEIKTPKIDINLHGLVLIQDGVIKINSSKVTLLDDNINMYFVKEDDDNVYLKLSFAQETQSKKKQIIKIKLRKNIVNGRIIEQNKKLP